MQIRDAPSEVVGGEFLVCLSIISNQTIPKEALFDHISQENNERRVLLKSNSNLLSLHEDLMVLPSQNPFLSSNSAGLVAKIEKKQG